MKSTVKDAFQSPFTERTVSLDRLLIQRADAKLRKYGWSFDEIVARALVAVLAVQGGPEQAFATQEAPQVVRRPGGLRGRVRVSPDFDAPSEEIADLFEHAPV